ncbi:hypothetical protein J3L16_03640 [Alteromonas sp. 5E99-2]|uniref:hypothetical protein n=1 Tax=Alteromonas sp. 5E99-2 TaxID=2817683 RepID=UPI001A9905E1|nr:hypothetical protein [Alteromonas sp. 5E99-2]MBO1254779.1 hypothetical protein [Alteromonas sp. 5E99-2]
MKNTKKQYVAFMTKTEIMQVTGGQGNTMSFVHNMHNPFEVTLAQDADRPHRPLIPKKKPT